MTVYVHYNGARFELPAGTDSDLVFNAIFDAQDRAWLLREDPVARSVGRHEGTLDDSFLPYHSLALAAGGHVTIHIHDGMQFALEDTERDDGFRYLSV
jgi:hypothetical protein